jgi:hypothetical protein
MDSSIDSRADAVPEQNVLKTAAEHEMRIPLLKEQGRDRLCALI